MNVAQTPGARYCWIQLVILQRGMNLLQNALLIGSVAVAVLLPLTSPLWSKRLHGMNGVDDENCMELSPTALEGD